MRSFLALCLTAFVCLSCSAQVVAKDEDGFYEWRLQLWEWETEEHDPDLYKIPKDAKLTEVVLLVRPGEEGFSETQMGNRTIGLALINKVNADNEPAVKVWGYVTNKGKLLKETRWPGFEEAKTFVLRNMTFGKRIMLGAGGTGAGITHCHAFSCTIEKKTRRDFFRAIEARSLLDWGDLPERK